MPPSHILLSLQIPASLPAPAPALLALVREREARCRFVAVMLPPCFRLRLGPARAGVAPALPLRGWAVVELTSSGPRPFLLGLAESDARQRADLLCKRGLLPTGGHLWN